MFRPCPAALFQVEKGAVIIAINDLARPVSMATPIPMPTPTPAPRALPRNMQARAPLHGKGAIAHSRDRARETAWRYQEHAQRRLSDCGTRPLFGNDAVLMRTASSSSAPSVALEVVAAGSVEDAADEIVAGSLPDVGDETVCMLKMIKDVADHAFSTDKKAARRAVKILISIALNRTAAQASYHAERWLLQLYMIAAKDKYRKMIVRQLNAAHYLFSKDVVARRTEHPQDFAMPAALLHIVSQHTWLALSAGGCTRPARHGLAGWDHLLLGALTGKCQVVSGVAAPEKWLSKMEKDSAMKRAVCCLPKEIELNEDQLLSKVDGQVAQLAALAGQLKVAMAILRVNGERYLLVAERPDGAAHCTLLLVKTNDHLDQRAKQRLAAVPVAQRSAVLTERLRRDTRNWMEAEVRRRLGLADRSRAGGAYSGLTVHDDIEQKTPYAGEVILYTLMDEIEQSRIAGDVGASARIAALSHAYCNSSVPFLKTVVMAQRAKMFADALEVASGSRFVPPALHIRKNFVPDQHTVASVVNAAWSNCN